MTKIRMNKILKDWITVAYRREISCFAQDNSYLKVKKSLLVNLKQILNWLQLLEQESEEGLGNWDNRQQARGTGRSRSQVTSE